MSKRNSLLRSLLELGHATSQNLEFAHQGDVFVSYGEETITETNLLELRRRNPAIIRLQTFSKKRESSNGADWEWHVIGRKLTLSMRVQAKRVRSDGTLRIPHKIASSGKEQIDVLIADAAHHKCLPVYCFYSAESQRTRWKSRHAPSGNLFFEAGCLLAPAKTVKKLMPKSLSAIEGNSIPWHHLVDSGQFARSESPLLEFPDPSKPGVLRLIGFESDWQLDGTDDKGSDAPCEFPNIDELNGETDLHRELQGVARTSERRRIDPLSFDQDRGISMVVELDARGIPPRAEAD